MRAAPIAFLAALLLAAPAHAEDRARAIADAFAGLPIEAGMVPAGYRLQERIRLTSDLWTFAGVETAGFRLDGPYGRVHAGALLFRTIADADRYRATYPNIHRELHRGSDWIVTTAVQLSNAPEATCMATQRSPEMICILPEPGTAAVLTVVMAPPPPGQIAIPRQAAVRRWAVAVLDAVLPGVRAHLARAHGAAGAPVAGQPSPGAPGSDAASRMAIDSAIRLFRDAPQPTTPARPSALYRRDYPAAREGQPGRTIGWMKDAAEPAIVAAVATRQPLVLVIVDGAGASHHMVANMLPCPSVNAFAGQALFAISDIDDDTFARGLVTDMRLEAKDLPAVVVHMPTAEGKLNGAWLLDFPTLPPLLAEIARVLRIPVPAPPALPAVGAYGPLRPRACG